MTALLRIHVERHFCHDSMDLDLPVGVTLITGVNGAGKSALAVESIAMACYGRTVRGGSPGDAWLSRVTCGDFAVERAKGKKGVALKLTLDGQAAAFETTTRAQKALEAHIGLDFAGWRRTHVFSAAGLAQFSEATDAERKRLLEGLLGLERFDKALAAVRTDLQVVRGRGLSSSFTMASLQRLHRTAQEDVEAQRTALEAILQAPMIEPPKLPDTDMTDDSIRMLEVQVSELREARDKVVAACTRAEDQLRSAERALSTGVCSACGRPFDDHDPETLAREVAVATEEVHAMTRQRREIDIRIETTHKAATAGLAALRATRVAIEKAEEEQRNRTADIQEARTYLGILEVRAVATDRDLEEAELASEADITELVTLGYVEKVLGLRGARALVLGDALDALEAEANEALAELAPGSRVGIGRSVGVPSGGDATIALTVTGLGGTPDYDGASAGERCRIDVALLLAIAAIAPPTCLPLVFDDVFGTLDEEGIDAVARVLMRVGQHRRVVVITQLDSLATRMRGVAQVVTL